MIIEVFIDLRAHGSIPAMVQTFIDANSGKVIDSNKLVGLNLQEVFTDSCGRKVMVFKSDK